MKNNYFFIFRWALYGILFALLSLQACKPTIQAPAFSMGEINASHYISVGNDYTAGVLNNVVSEGGQLSSFPALLAKQFNLVRPVNFYLPLMPLGMMDKQLAVEKWDSVYLGCPDKILLQGVHPIKSTLAFDQIQGIFHNFGSPNIKIKEVTKILTHKDLTRFIHNAETYLRAIHIAQPTFFSVEMGFADVRNYARLGGTCDAGCMPSQREFEIMYQMVLDTLKTPDNQGIIFSIPDITEMPYLNFAKNYFGDTANCSVSFFYIEDNEGNIRVAKEGEVFLLTEVETIIKSEQGTSPDNPIRDFYCLDSKEMHQLQAYIISYNDVIRKLAEKYNLAFVDLNQIFHEINTVGYMQDGIQLNNTYITGGFYSIDGYSLSPRGNAYIGNKIISVLNTKYHANIPFLNLGDYPVVKLE